MVEIILLKCSHYNNNYILFIKGKCSKYHPIRKLENENFAKIHDIIQALALKPEILIYKNVEDTLSFMVSISFNSLSDSGIHNFH